MLVDEDGSWLTAHAQPGAGASFFRRPPSLVPKSFHFIQSPNYYPPSLVQVGFCCFFFNSSFPCFFFSFVYSFFTFLIYSCPSVHSSFFSFILLPFYFRLNFFFLPLSKHFISFVYFLTCPFLMAVLFSVLFSRLFFSFATISH